MLTSFAFALVVAPALLAAPASPPTAAAKVRYVAGAAAYLDRGVRDGLASGTSINFERRGKSAGNCVVDAVSDHAARCSFVDRAHIVAGAGDRVVFVKSDVTDPADAAAAAPPVVLEDAALAAARGVVLATELPKVVFPKSRRRSGGDIANRVDASLRVRSWSTIGSNDSTFVRPSLDVGMRVGIPLVRGLFASSALRVQGDVLAPAGERFRNSVPAELYVWDAAVGIAPGLLPITGVVGRFRPEKAPGMTVIDGALAGYVGLGGALEVGGYAGLIPDPVTTAPSFDRVAVGAYAGFDAAPMSGLLLLPRARIGLITAPDLSKTRAEAELQMQTLFTRALAVGGSLRVAVPGDTATPVIDAARVDVDWAPLDSLRLRADWRSLGDQHGEFDAGVVSDNTVVGDTRATHHGSAGVDWNASDSFVGGVVVGAVGAIAIDSASGDLRGSVGPEVALPHLFGDVGGISVGAAEEPGTLWGRSAFVQTQTQPLTGLRWSTRLSYFEHEAPFIDAKDGALREALAMTFVDAPLLPWLSLRGRAQGLFDIVDVDGFGATPVGVFVDVGLNGHL